MLIDGIVASGVSGLNVPDFGTGDVIITHDGDYIVTKAGARIAYYIGQINLVDGLILNSKDELDGDEALILNNGLGNLEIQ